MKNKNSLPLMAVLMFSSVCFGQKDMSKEEFLNSLFEKTKTDYQNYYDNAIDNIYKVSSKPSVYLDLVNSVNSSINNSSKLNKIALAINPSSTVLTDESYNDYLKRVATEVFKGKIKPDEITQVSSVIENIASTSDQGGVPKLGKFIGNVVKGFVSATPVLNLANGIISGLAGIFKFKKVTAARTEVLGPEVLTAFQNKDLDEFRKKISPYVNFYDSALQLNLKFATEINGFTDKARSYDSLAKVLVNDLNNYGKNTLKINLSVSNEIRNTFKYDFEDFYTMSMIRGLTAY